MGLIYSGSCQSWVTACVPLITKKNHVVSWSAGAQMTHAASSAKGIWARRSQRHQLSTNNQRLSMWRGLLPHSCRCCQGNCHSVFSPPHCVCFSPGSQSLAKHRSQEWQFLQSSFSLGRTHPGRSTREQSPTPTPATHTHKCNLINKD